MLDLLKDTKEKIIGLMKTTRQYEEISEAINEICHIHNEKVEFYHNTPKIANINIDKALTKVTLSLMVAEDHIEKMLVTK